MQELLAPEISARLERLVRLARRVRPAKRRGALHQPARGIEVGGRRDYVPGDDPRQVDWPAYARLERLLVKVTEELPEPRLDLLIDGSASMRCGEPCPALRAALAAAGLAAVALAREVKTTVWIAGPGADRIALGRASELVRLLRFLAQPREVQPRTATQAAEAGVGLVRLAEQVAQRVAHPGAAVVLSDGLSAEVLEAGSRLRARGCQVRVAFVEAAAEVGPQALHELGAGALVELVDAESGRRELRTLGPLGLAAASEERRARQRALEGQLQAAGLSCLRLPPGDPFERLAEVLLRSQA